MITKILFGFSVVLLASCAGESGSANEPSEGKAPTSMLNPNLSNPEFLKGEDLVARYQCLTCHKVDEKLTGPSYLEIAEKYAGADDAMISELAKKIIDGGSGVWGELPMTPHPNISTEDAKVMTKYILLLKN